MVTQHAMDEVEIQQRSGMDLSKIAAYHPRVNKVDLISGK